MVLDRKLSAMIEYSTLMPCQLRCVLNNVRPQPLSLPWASRNMNYIDGPTPRLCTAFQTSHPRCRQNPRAGTTNPTPGVSNRPHVKLYARIFFSSATNYPAVNASVSPLLRFTYQPFVPSGAPRKRSGCQAFTWEHPLYATTVAPFLERPYQPSSS